MKKKLNLFAYKFDTNLHRISVNAYESTLKNVKSETHPFQVNPDLCQKKKDGPNHPFQSNLTYFYEKKLICNAAFQIQSKTTSKIS